MEHNLFQNQALINVLIYLSGLLNIYHGTIWLHECIPFFSQIVFNLVQRVGGDQKWTRAV